MQTQSVTSAGDRERRADVTVEKRKAPRLEASIVPSITGIRLSPYGADATLVNISGSGVLVECSSRLQQGTSVTVVFDGTFSPSSIEGRVAHCSVATIGRKGVLRYHVGIAFKNPITLEDAPQAASPQPEIAPEPQGARPVRAILSNRW